MGSCISDTRKVVPISDSNNHIEKQKIKYYYATTLNPLHTQICNENKEIMFKF
jgi:hypothetical protein